MTPRLFFLIFAFISLLFSEEPLFKLYAWGIPVGEVCIEVNENHINEKYENIKYSVRTKGVLRALYKIENSYEFVVDKKNNNLYSFHKNIDQFNMKQAYFEEHRSRGIYYSTGDSLLYEGIYSHPLLYIFQKQKLNMLSPANTMHIEGVFYNAELVKTSHSTGGFDKGITWQLKLFPYQGKSILKKTDVFSWKIVDPEAKKYVIYDEESRKLIGAQFSFKGITVTAHRID